MVSPVSSQSVRAQRKEMPRPEPRPVRVSKVDEPDQTKPQQDGDGDDDEPDQTKPQQNDNNDDQQE